MDCLDEKILSLYLDEKLSEDERCRIENHISRCNHCLDLLLVAHGAQYTSKRYPAYLKQRIKKRLGLNQKRPRPEIKWFLGALFLFLLSFVFKRFFLQFLVAASILGFKWVIEGEGIKRWIMIFKGIQTEDKKNERKPPPSVSDITGGDRYDKYQ